jgi:hypothetical protein
VARPSLRYQPRSPTQRVLYQVVRDHLETFRLRATRLDDGAGLPRFVQEEFEGFLRCGFLAGGFARFQCARCRHEHLLPFSAIMPISLRRHRRAQGWRRCGHRPHLPP